MLKDNDSCIAQLSWPRLSAVHEAHALVPPARTTMNVVLFHNFISGKKIKCRRFPSFLSENIIEVGPFLSSLSGKYLNVAFFSLIRIIFENT